MTISKQPRPQATEYWRYGDVLVYVTMVRRFREEEEWSTEGWPEEAKEEGWVAFRRAGFQPGEGESEVPVWEFRRDATLVFSDRQKDEVLDRLRQHEKDLLDLSRIAHGVAVVGAGLEGELLTVVRNAAEALDASAVATRRTLATVQRMIQRDRTYKHQAARRALNDELGIPNCDHVVLDPGCLECTKPRMKS